MFGVAKLNAEVQKLFNSIRIREYFKYAVAKPIYGVITGIVSTVLFQSSSATSVLVVGMVSAGLISLYHSLGIILGGWRVIRTVGMRITTLRPVHGSAAEVAAAGVIEAASNLGIPVSTTQCISGSVIGVGATKRLSAVRWGVARSLVVAWVLTFPICISLGWLLEKLLSAVL